MIYTLSGLLTHSQVNPNVLLANFEEKHSEIKYIELDTLEELETKWQANRQSHCIFTINHTPIAIYRPVFGSDTRKESRIAFNHEKEEIYFEIQDAVVAASDQMGIPAELIHEVATQAQVADTRHSFFSHVADVTGLATWVHASNFRFEHYRIDQKTGEQIWHLPRSKFLHHCLTLDELKCLYSNNLGRVKTFEELKNMMINSCGIHLTLSEAFELMKDQYPNLEENFNYVFNEISEAREQINLLRNKCDQLLEEIK